MYLVSALRAPESRDAGVRRARGVSGGRLATERAAAGCRQRGQAVAIRVRHRQLLLDAWRRRARRTRADPGRRQAVVDAGRRPEPSRLAERIRRRPGGRRIHLRVEGHPFTVIGIAPPGFFGDTLRSDPPDMWIPIQQEPLDRRQRRRCCVNRCRRGFVSLAGSSRTQPSTGWRPGSRKSSGSG